MTSSTLFPLGVMAGGPNGSSPAAEAAFEAQFRSFTSLMGATPTFMNAFVDQSQPISSWAANASWTAWSWAQSPLARTMTPVIGLPMATNADAGNQDAVFKAFTSGAYDGVLRGIVSAWANQGFKTLYIRPGYEMNGTFMPWYAGSDPATQAHWVAAFRHIADVLHADTDANVKVIWNPNVQSWNGSLDPKTLYPGDKYVDVVGADIYSPAYPRDLYDWALNNGTVDSSLAQWAAKPANLQHYWNNPAANQWNPVSDGQGNSLSLQDMIDFAKAHGKPLAIAETGAGGDGTQGPSDNPAFPAWLAGKLAASGVSVAMVNIWDLNAGDGDWSFTGTGTGASRPLEAAAWAKAFGAGSTATAPVTLGTGADSIVLNVSEDAWNGDAQYTVAVDGQQVGGTQTATASHAAGQTQAVTLLGAWGTGAHAVAVRFLNDAWGGNAAADRNLYVDSVVDGTTTAAGAALMGNGTASFAVGAPASVSVGSGADTLVLHVSEDAWNGDAQFTVAVDGKQVGGTLTATASHAAGATGTVNVLGTFGTGTHDVAVNFLNDGYGGTAASDRNLYVDSLAYGGATTVGAAMLSSGIRHFTAGQPTTFPGTTLGSGPRAITLAVSEDAWNGDAQFVVTVDGQQIGGTQTATALHAAGASQVFSLLGSFAPGSHAVAVSFLNDAWGGTATTDRNLYVDKVGSVGVGAALFSAGTSTFTTVVPAS